jgi:hypothetical protein
VKYKFKMNIKLKAVWQTILQNCIVHAKQYEITHTEMSLKQSYIPTLEGEVCCLLQKQWSFNLSDCPSAPYRLDNLDCTIPVRQTEWKDMMRISITVHKFASGSSQLDINTFQPMIYLLLMGGHMYSWNDWRLTTNSAWRWSSKHMQMMASYCTISRRRMERVTLYLLV